jgi:hypothetical protein
MAIELAESTQVALGLLMGAEGAFPLGLLQGLVERFPNDTAPAARPRDFPQATISEVALNLEKTIRKVVAEGPEPSAYTFPSCDWEAVALACLVHAKVFAFFRARLAPQGWSDEAIYAAHGKAHAWSARRAADKEALVRQIEEMGDGREESPDPP